MISRRNIRVKVMQTLYSVESQEELIKPGEPVKLLQKHFDQTRQLLVFIIHFLTEVARYAEIDARNRASKHLPSKEDLNVNTKIAGNEVLWKILEHPSYKKALKEDKPEQIESKIWFGRSMENWQKPINTYNTSHLEKERADQRRRYLNLFLPI